MISLRPAPAGRPMFGEGFDGGGHERPHSVVLDRSVA